MEFHDPVDLADDRQGVEVEGLKHLAPYDHVECFILKRQAVVAEVARLVADGRTDF